MFGGVATLTTRHLELDDESKLDVRHGVAHAAKMVESDGEPTAIAWSKDHEALPLHHADECPMLPSAPPRAS